MVRSLLLRCCCVCVVLVCVLCLFNVIVRRVCDLLRVVATCVCVYCSFFAGLCVLI